MSEPDDPIARAEKRGYARGYQAGKRRKAANLDAEARRRREDAFWRQCLLAALPFAMQQNGWQTGPKDARVEISSINQRVHLASNVADAAVREAFNRGRSA